MKYIGIISLLLMVMFAGGCARTVTPLFDQGKTVTIDIRFKEDIKTSDNKYYVLLHAAASPQLPFDPKRFVEPGEVPSQPEVNYQNYYDTWDYFFYLENNVIWLAKGPFVTTEAGTRESITFWDNSDPRRILINYNLDLLSLSSSIIYFDFVTVGVNDKIVKDNLSHLNSSVSTQYIDTTFAGTYLRGTDEASSVIPGSADILSWSVTVQ